MSAVSLVYEELGRMCADISRTSARASLHLLMRFMQITDTFALPSLLVLGGLDREHRLRTYQEVVVVVGVPRVRALVAIAQSPDIAAPSAVGDTQTASGSNWPSRG